MHAPPPHADDPDHDHGHRLRQQIHCLSERLQEIGGGDCAYEKALARAYRLLLAQHRSQLAALTARP